MWPDLIRRAKEGGLNVIQTYVFWNIHEPVEGKVCMAHFSVSGCAQDISIFIFCRFLLVQFNFEGNYDLLKFIRLLGDSGLWVTLRIGPYIEAEWNLGYMIHSVFFFKILCLE